MQTSARVSVDHSIALERYQLYHQLGYLAIILLSRSLSHALSRKEHFVHSREQVLLKRLYLAIPSLYALTSAAGSAVSGGNASP